MRYFAPFRIRIEKDVIIRVVRALKGKGALNVNTGQEVEPAQIIGSATVSAGFRTLNLSALLGVAPQEAEKYLTRKLGQRIYKGELLAFKKGWMLSGKKVVTAPTDGILDFLNNKTGELKISFLPRKVDLPAGVYGVVEVVDKERGQVIIRTQASRIQGVVGSGKSRDGILRILSKKDDLVGKVAIGVGSDGQVLVGGSLFFKDAISAAISAGVTGIITGGINAQDYRGMANGRLVFPRKLENDIGIGVVVCEGFGSIPIGNDIFSLLQQYEGKFIFIDGNKALVDLPCSSSSCLTKVKSTGLPGLQKEDLPNLINVKEELELKVGLKVRITGNSYQGEQGKIIAVDNSLTLLPSGIKTYLATVETGRRKIQLPVANLEIIM